MNPNGLEDLRSRPSYDRKLYISLFHISLRVVNITCIINVSIKGTCLLQDVQCTASSDMYTCFDGLDL